MAAGKRNDGESFEHYRARLKREAKLAKRKERTARLWWDSSGGRTYVRDWRSELGFDR